ncbi:small acid-soluble spore protein H (minor) [Cerasibacillus quisquiliarum]|uniref:Small, acid-soluble spore protein H n=1 Tax=Cerasibacillus quisquiliarum TaxID=227865 RepID=A0A511V0Q1_9BACI|nr:H-type small acid-soluble spore protein [Cerasibacillus quisquiliarum]MBB5146177.1 small acid-soluble spore protein H (minor) [Cerasibacillus quisquiliarum]GEN30912.1 small, acid-soluble spore protein H [Cerasibacillus quisquiliarum]
MNRNRAIEISKSPNLKHVTYQGKRVYIQHVHKTSDMAKVYLLDDPTKEFEVQLDQLEER